LVSASQLEICCTQPARAASVPLLRRLIVTFAAENGVSKARQEDVALAVSEALSNAVVHAYVGLAAPLSVCARAWIEDGLLKVSICDEGIGMRPRTDSPGLGIGLAFIASLAAELEIHDAQPGVQICMTFAFS
jgi:serine/threonine-protein kinase RsbW